MRRPDRGPRHEGSPERGAGRWRLAFGSGDKKNRTRANQDAAWEDLAGVEILTRTATTQDGRRGWLIVPEAAAAAIRGPTQPENLTYATGERHSRKSLQHNNRTPSPPRPRLRQEEGGEETPGGGAPQRVASAPPALPLSVKDQFRDRAQSHSERESPLDAGDRLDPAVSAELEALRTAVTGTGDCFLSLRSPHNGCGPLSGGRWRPRGSALRGPSELAPGGLHDPSGPGGGAGIGTTPGRSWTVRMERAPKRDGRPDP